MRTRLPTYRLLLITPRLETTGRLVRAFSEIPVELPPPDADPSVIAMRFGRLTLADGDSDGDSDGDGDSEQGAVAGGLRLYLFGLPWGLAFREMWDVVGRDLFGVLAATGTDTKPDDATAMQAALHDFAGEKLVWLAAEAPLDNPPALLRALLTATGHAQLIPLLAKHDFSAA